MASVVTFPDGEKVPDDQVTTIFRPPPDIPEEFCRSTLIVGAKGAGKTLLLRYHRAKHTEKGIAVQLWLNIELSPITRQVAHGPMAYETPPDLKSAIPGMATSLLGLSIAGSILNQNLRLEREPVAALIECLPDFLRSSRSITVDLDWIKSTKTLVAKNKNL
jgi:hypothetical protein